jgi:predicted DsbA family dithiol-disulfide isomerase
MMDHLRSTAKELGLSFGARSKTYNSRLAQEMGLWAEDLGKGEQFHLAAFQAYFADGLNLARMPVLLQLARQVGLPEQEAEKIISSRAYQHQVDQDWSDSRSKAIHAVPTLVMGQHKLVGAQSYQAMTELIIHYGISKKEPPK